MIIAIDGPAGSGKSTIAQGVARRLDLTYLDTGAMYRAVTLIAMEQSLPLDDDDALGSLALKVPLRFSGAPGAPPQVHVGDRDVTEAIRLPAVSQKVSLVAAHPSVRRALTVRQRELVGLGDIVIEGRDTGTVVCPRADLKVYLTASVEERARRRQSQLQEQGVCIALPSLERELLLRDTHDAGRAVAPLRKARDAMEIDTTDLSAQMVIERICDEAVRRAGGEARAC